MKFIPVILLFGINIAAFSQCNIIENVTDQSGAIKKISTQSIIAEEKYGNSDYLTFTSNSGFFSLKVHKVFNYVFNAMVDESDLVVLNFVNDSMIKLYPMYMTNSKTEEDMRGVTISILDVVYDMTREQLELLAKVPLASFKMYTHSGIKDFDVDEFYRKGIMQQAKCILDNIQ